MTRAWAEDQGACRFPGCKSVNPLQGGAHDTACQARVSGGQLSFLSLQKGPVQPAFLSLQEGPVQPAFLSLHEALWLVTAPRFNRKHVLESL